MLINEDLMVNYQKNAKNCTDYQPRFLLLVEVSFCFRGQKPSHFFQKLPVEKDMSWFAQKFREQRIESSFKRTDLYLEQHITAYYHVMSTFINKNDFVCTQWTKI